MMWTRYGLLETIYNETMTTYNDNLHVEDTETQKNLGATVGQETITSYCRITECRTITCSFIPTTSDAGRVASNFIETVFKVNCKNVKSVKLSFDKCKFSANKLRKNWLLTNVSIEELTLSNCSLNEIEDDAFAGTIYKEMKKIDLINNNISSLRKAMFRNISALGEFSVRNNILKQAEFNLLENVANSLSILDLYGAIDDPCVLRNITGGDTPLNIQILSLRGNAIPVISRELFEGVRTVQSLYLDYSKIMTISQGALEPLAASILQLIINDNNIRALPEGLLDSILDHQQPFYMTLHNNPWNCECSLQWMQDFVQTHPHIMTSVPICSTPDSNAGKPFSTATFCSSDSTTSVTKSTTKSTKHDWGVTTFEAPTASQEATTEGIHLNCNISNTILQMSTFLSTDIRFSPRFPDFFILKNMDHGVLINLPDLEEGIVLLWFNSYDVENSLSCAKNVKHTYLLQDIDPQTTYTICLLNDNDTTVSPLNCLAVTTQPTYKSRTWLTNADKGVVFLTFSVSLLLFLVIGAFIAFMLIRRNPSLLRGSKRVMLVKRRNVDAIVLPKGVNVDEAKRSCRNAATINNKLLEDGYITPLPPAPMLLPRGRVSRVSMQSDWNSYVSEFEATEQLDSWRMTRLNSELEKQKSDAPPLPPPNSIPSVSLTVDSREYNCVCQDTVV
ncbi:uncharacterized protein LOC143340209 [Colletes latitarsis]|uniref:uncharacterized protein LOC143340209 n=1 Tax=Colletes latitarsis TaxID=2605962 RepID=UPI004036322F